MKKQVNGFAHWQSPYVSYLQNVKDSKIEMTSYEDYLEVEIKSEATKQVIRIQYDVLQQILPYLAYCTEHRMLFGDDDEI